MSNKEGRIKKLEERIHPGEQVVFTVVYEGDNTKPTKEQTEAAVARVKANNPNIKEKEGEWIVLYWADGNYIFDRKQIEGF